jgi:hypothetical protein
MQQVDHAVSVLLPSQIDTTSLDLAPVWDMAWLVAAIVGGGLTIGSVNN